MRIPILPVLLLALSSCTTIASTAIDVVTLPVKVVSKGVDAATTSQSEADEKRGREIREAEEKAGKKARKLDKACRQAAAKGQPCAMAPPPQ
ncbi:MAG: hypothetical protein ACJ8EY_10795 [Sphingomicrobium sp.]